SFGNMSGLLVCPIQSSPHLTAMRTHSTTLPPAKTTVALPKRANRLSCPEKRARSQKSRREETVHVRCTHPSPARATPDRGHLRGTAVARRLLPRHRFRRLAAVQRGGLRGAAHRLHGCVLLQGR